MCVGKLTLLTRIPKPNQPKLTNPNHNPSTSLGPNRRVCSGGRAHHLHVDREHGLRPTMARAVVWLEVCEDRSYMHMHMCMHMCMHMHMSHHNMFTCP